MSRHNQKIGHWGESIAAEYLQNRGYFIIARNVRTPYGEIDILAEKDSITVFIEVKTRTSSSYGPPEIAVTPRKREHMLNTAEYYAQEHEIDHWQIDVVAVEKKGNDNPDITHFEDALG